MDQAMQKNRLRLEMAVDRYSWRNGSVPGRPMRVGVQTRASSRKCLCNFLFIIIIIIIMIITNTIFIQETGHKGDTEAGLYLGL